MFKNLFSKNKPHFKIENSSFTINNKALIAVINTKGEFCWAMDIYTSEGNYLDDSCSPMFSFTELEPADEFKLNKEFIWNNTSAYNKTIEDWVGSFTIHNSQFFKCSISLLKKSNSEFFIKIKGEVNTNWESEEGENLVPFSITTPLEFNGILCEIDDRDEALKIAAKYLDSNNLKWTKKDEDIQQFDNWLRYQ